MSCLFGRSTIVETLMTDANVNNVMLGGKVPLVVVNDGDQGISINSYRQW